MIELTKVKPASNIIMDEIGYTWDKCFNELVPMTQSQVDEVYNATESLYSMFSYAADLAIRNNLWDKFGIKNPKLIEVIKKEWNDDKFKHVWGRFDFAGGTSDKPIKLIEFNADTATAIVETSCLQYAVAKTNNLEENQFNDVYESLIDAFKDFQINWDLHDDISAVAISLDTEEDERTINFISESAAVSGIDISVVPMNKIYFDKRQGIFISNDGVNIDKTFNVIIKLVPWEMIVEHEPEYADIIFDLILNDELVVINPAYTLLFQSKYMLKFLYELYPDNKYILKCSETPLPGIKQVKKPIFGREGSNVSIIEFNNVNYKEDGPYDNQPVIYQEYVEFDKDAQGRIYQIGSFMCNYACGMAFRRSENPIIVNTSEFVGHYIK